MQLGNEKISKPARRGRTGHVHPEGQLARFEAMKLTYTVANRAARQRAVLRDMINQHGQTTAVIARAAGFRNANMIYNFMNQESDALSLETVRQLSTVMPGLLAAWLNAAEPPSDLATADPGVNAADDMQAALARVTPGPAVRLVHEYHGCTPAVVAPVGVEIQMEACAGLRRENARLLSSARRFVGVPIPPSLQGKRAFGVTVRGDDQLYADGTTLVCLPIRGNTDKLVGGRRVIFVKSRKNCETDACTEVTVRELVERDGRIWLASHPADEEMELMPVGHMGYAWLRGDDYRKIVGIVVMACVPEVTA